MTKYKVGDVAALFSKPKDATTAGGKKLQSLFENYYNKKSKSVVHSPKEENFEIDRKTEDVKVGNPREFKKGKKRKFSSNDSELNENVFSKKFKKSSEQEECSKSNKNKMHKNFGKQEDFPRKNNNDSDLNTIFFSKKFKESFEQEDSKSNVCKKLKKQQDSPKKSKKSKVNQWNTSSTYSKFEAGNAFENDTKLPSTCELQNVSKVNKQYKSFIKKSKKKSSEYNKSKLLNNVLSKDSDDEDALLKNEIKQFMHNNNSLKDKVECSNDNTKQEKSFKSKDQGKKTKEKYLTIADASPQKYEESSKQDRKMSKKMKNKHNSQQDFPTINKESEAKSFGNTESEIRYDSVEQDSQLKKSKSIEKKDKKQSKKSKHELNDTYSNNLLTSEDKSETSTTRTNKVADFIRKPKNKGKGGTLGKDDFKKSSGKADKHKEFNVNNTMQEKGSNIETLDFIKLPHSDEGNDEELLNRTLFVGNLCKNTSRQELKNLFSNFGVIKSVRLAGVETDKAKIYGKNPPKLLHSNYASETIPGFIVFSDRASAVQALNLSGSMFKGRHITVDFAQEAGTHKLYDSKRSIFIGNLPFNVKDESVWNAFNECGRIEAVRVVRDRETGLGKGFGYVLFSTAEGKDKALALGNLHIEGREIRIKVTNSSKKAQKPHLISVKRNTFKSHAIRMRKTKGKHGRKSVRKLTNKQKNLHQKKKIASILQKAMK